MKLASNTLALDLKDVVHDVLKDFGTDGYIIKTDTGVVDRFSGEVTTAPDEEPVRYVTESIPAGALIEGKIENGDCMITLSCDVKVTKNDRFKDIHGALWNIITNPETELSGIGLIYILQVRK